MLKLAYSFSPSNSYLFLPSVISHYPLVYMDLPKLKPNDLIIISGLPCSGKSRLATTLAQKFVCPLIARDGLKEVLFDSLGVYDATWSKQIGLTSYNLLYYILEKQIHGRCGMIIESNFDLVRDSAKLEHYIRMYDVRALQIHCYCKPNILVERFRKRASSGKRHPGHVDIDRLQEIADRIYSDTGNALSLNAPLIVFDTSFTFDSEAVIYAITKWLNNGAMEAAA
jgi:predicted kinase